MLMSVERALSQWRGGVRRGWRDDRGAVPGGIRVGGGHLRLPGRGGGRRGRAGAVDLGHVRRDAGTGGRGGHRGGGRRPLPPVPGGRGPHGRPGARGLPVLGRLAAGPARRALGQPRGAGLLPAAGRQAAGVRDRAVGDPVPLGPPPGAAGRGRLGQPPGGGPLRRLRDPGRGGGRPGLGPAAVSRPAPTGEEWPPAPARTGRCRPRWPGPGGRRPPG
jgi:hypothetical protein